MSQNIDLYISAHFYGAPRNVAHPESRDTAETWLFIVYVYVYGHEGFEMSRLLTIAYRYYSWNFLRNTIYKIGLSWNIQNQNGLSHWF